MVRHKNKAGLREVLSAFLNEVDSTAPSGHCFVAATREDLRNELVAFGEDAVATKIAKLPKAKLSEIFRRAGELAAQTCTSSHGQALCLAAIEVVEGTARPLARRRRRRSI